MNNVQLLSHGERVRIEYAPLPGETQGAAGISTAAERQDGKKYGIIRRYKKNEEAAFNAQALGWIRSVYSDAIEYTNVTKELKGLAFVWGLFSGLISLVLAGCGIVVLTFIRLNSWFDIGFFVVGLGMAVGCSAFGAYAFCFLVRVDLFGPIDLPIIFDRKHRKVYRILREEQPGFKGAFKPWPLIACEYDWDLIDAEHQADLYTTGGSISRNHFLMFLVRKSKDDPTIIDSFQIGSANALSEELTDCMWEHIRRFMEEHGPHLPTPDEPLSSIEPPTSWWQSMGAVGPFGPNYLRYWHDSPGFTLALHLIFPVTIPMLFFWGIGNWLSYKTGIPFEWPDKVLAAIGAQR